jgi:hypothetical protein
MSSMSERVNALQQKQADLLAKIASLERAEREEVAAGLDPDIDGHDQEGL